MHKQRERERERLFSNSFFAQHPKTQQRQENEFFSQESSYFFRQNSVSLSLTKLFSHTEVGLPRSSSVDWSNSFSQPEWRRRRPTCPAAEEAALVQHFLFLLSTRFRPQNRALEPPLLGKMDCEKWTISVKISWRLFKAEKRHQNAF